MRRAISLNNDIQERIVRAIQAGNYQETAARFGGIGVSTFYKWMARGLEEPESKYGEFREAIENAKAQAEVFDVALIDQAAKDGSWQAAAWKLERKFPHRWGRVQRTEISGPDGQAVKVEVDAKTELLKALGLADDADTNI
jgi:transposase